jgi:hypothetical protein
MCDFVSAVGAVYTCDFACDYMCDFVCNLMADAIFGPIRNHDRLHVPCDFMCDSLYNFVCNLGEKKD